MLSLLFSLVSLFSLQGKVVGTRLTSLVDLPTTYKIQYGRGPVAWDFSVAMEFWGSRRGGPLKFWDSNDSLWNNWEQTSSSLWANLQMGLTRWHQRPAFSVGSWKLVPWWGMQFWIRGRYEKQKATRTDQNTGEWDRSTTLQGEVFLGLGPRLRLDVIPPLANGRVFLQATIGLLGLEGGYHWDHSEQERPSGTTERHQDGPEGRFFYNDFPTGLFALWLMFQL